MIFFLFSFEILTVFDYEYFEMILMFFSKDESNFSFVKFINCFDKHSIKPFYVALMFFIVSF